MKSVRHFMDIVLCTSFDKNANWSELMELVDYHGKMVILAIPEVPLVIPGNAFISRNVSMVGSMMGGLETTREMFDFVGKHNIRPWIEEMPMSDATAAAKHAKDGRPRFRVVMDASK
ncbi:hypothetical protein BGW38_003113 [Lunasporangiospora selenospora]|uniref:Zinc-binding dehydrogenase n=1 Tax=Lunasporangiospora selenospora TaxID=979761 RepID=A0A9P6KCF6_9FUNG|nr:hypothetical protein BGW38_003113 [Lunasporangiospora selenospora]